MIECAVCHKDVCNHPKYSVFGLNGKWHWRCHLCGDSGEGAEPDHYFVPMYEGVVVNPDTQEWAGFDACKECSDKSLEVKQCKGS